MVASFWKSLSRYLKVLSCVSLLCDVLYLWASVGREAVSEGIYIGFFFFFLHAQRSVSSLGKCQEVVDYKSQSFTILQHLASSRGYFLTPAGRPSTNGMPCWVLGSTHFEQLLGDTTQSHCNICRITGNKCGLPFWLSNLHWCLKRCCYSYVDVCMYVCIDRCMDG